MSHSRWPEAGRRSPTHRSGSASSDPPELLAASAGPGGPATNKELRWNSTSSTCPRPTTTTATTSRPGKARSSNCLRAPLFSSQAVSDYFRKLLGTSRSPGDGAAGAEMHGSVRPTGARGRSECPAAAHPDPFHRRRQARRGRRRRRRPLSGVGRTQQPVPAGVVPGHRLSADASPPKSPTPVFRTTTCCGDACLASASAPRFCAAAPMATNSTSRRSSICSSICAPATRHRNTSTWNAANSLATSVSSSCSTPPDRPPIPIPTACAVHDHQRRAAATLAATLEELGDRVAVYAFRSQGRHAVHLPAIKTFEQRFGALGRARLNQLQPSRYTRLGAGIRGAGEILKTQAGTPNRLLLVLSDGFPYDDGYEGRYARSRHPQGARGTSRRRRCLPMPFHRRPLRPPMRSNASSAPPAMPARRPWLT